MVDRLARNRADDALIALQIREAGAQLVSVSENIDETPSGLLLQQVQKRLHEISGEISRWWKILEVPYQEYVLSKWD